MAQATTATTTKKVAKKTTASTSKTSTTVRAAKKQRGPVINRTTHQIDAAGQVLGRLAVRIAYLLRGKNKPTWQPHIDNGDFVAISHAKQIVVTGKKIEQKMYYNHTDYFGGLKERPMKRMIVTKPDWIIRKAVWNMLPKNKLRADMMKRLTITL